MMDAKTSILRPASVHQRDVWRPLSGRQQSTRWTSSNHEWDVQRPQLGCQKGVSIHHCTRRAGAERSHRDEAALLRSNA
jgi:hypothetical protein